MKRLLILWAFVRIVRASVVIERWASAIRDVCQGIQAGYCVAALMGADVPALQEERPRLRLVRGGRS